MSPGDFEAFAERFAAERKRLDQLRADYTTIISSRFHALRMLWFSLKSLFNANSPLDRYAVWSRGIVPGTGMSVQVDITRDSRWTEEDRRLVATWNARPGTRLPAADPIVSIVIPVHDHRDVTVTCLQSLADTWPSTLDVQAIVVDDGSSDTMASLVSRMDALDYVRTCANEGFIRACNLGAALARGKYLLFLNNDTIVRGGAIDYLVRTAEENPTVGIVGSKLVFPSGQMQTAGAIVWRDATGWEYGKFENPADPRYNYVRDVDYVSGAALLVRAELFQRLGGFDRKLQRAYYEDTDLCFATRKMGYRVVYQPLSEIVHFETVSSPNEATSMKRFQEVNRPAFREKWAAELVQHFDNKPANVAAAARRLRGAPVFLVVDTHVPLYDRDAGSSRLMHVIRILRDIGCHVMFLPENYAGLQPYTQELQQLGVEVLYHVDQGRSMEEALNEVLPLVDYAWISRPELYSTYGPLVRRNRRVKTIYDTVDLHFVRKKREAELNGAGPEEWKSWQQLELEAAHDADATVVVTTEERGVLEEFRINNVYVIPTIHPLEVVTKRTPEMTSGVLFIGNYNHQPNVDACVWLANEIMPLVWGRLPQVHLTIVGANPSESVLQLESDRVRISGYVADVAPYFLQSRLFVAPLRYGAGMKGKIGQALAFRLPVVTTPVGAEGFGSKGALMVVPARAQDFADAIVHLYRNESEWKRLSDSSEATLLPFSPAAVAPKLRAMMDDLADNRRAAMAF